MGKLKTTLIGVIGVFSLLMGMMASTLTPMAAAAQSADFGINSISKSCQSQTVLIDYWNTASITSSVVSLSNQSSDYATQASLSESVGFDHHTVSMVVVEVETGSGSTYWYEAYLGECGVGVQPTGGITNANSGGNSETPNLPWVSVTSLSCTEFTWEVYSESPVRPVMVIQAGDGFNYTDIPFAKAFDHPGDGLLSGSEVFDIPSDFPGGPMIATISILDGQGGYLADTLKSIDCDEFGNVVDPGQGEIPDTPTIQFANGALICSTLEFSFGYQATGESLDIIVQPRYGLVKGDPEFIEVDTSGEWQLVSLDIPKEWLDNGLVEIGVLAYSGDEYLDGITIAVPDDCGESEDPSEFSVEIVDVSYTCPAMELMVTMDLGDKVFEDGYKVSAIVFDGPQDDDSRSYLTDFTLTFNGSGIVSQKVDLQDVDLPEEFWVYVSGMSDEVEKWANFTQCEFEDPGNGDPSNGDPGEGEDPTPTETPTPDPTETPGPTPDPTEEPTETPVPTEVPDNGEVPSDEAEDPNPSEDTETPLESEDGYSSEETETPEQADETGEVNVPDSEVSGATDLPVTGVGISQVQSQTTSIFLVMAAAALALMGWGIRKKQTI